MKKNVLTILLAIGFSTLALSCMKAGDGVGLTTSGSIAPRTDPCLANPLAAGCPPIDTCKLTPPAAGCIDPCIANPQLPKCVEAACKANPNLPGCTPIVDCSILPKKVECLDRDYFKANVLPIFKDHCIACHVKPNGLAWDPVKLALDSVMAWDSLVNIRSREMIPPDFDPMYRIRPGMPDSSYLWLKITMAKPPSGVKMPASGAPLTAAQIAIIKTWIIGKP